MQLDYERLTGRWLPESVGEESSMHQMPICHCGFHTDLDTPVKSSSTHDKSVYKDVSLKGESAPGI